MSLFFLFRNWNEIARLIRAYKISLKSREEGILCKDLRKKKISLALPLVDLSHSIK